MLRIWQKTEKQKLEPVGMGTAFPFLKEKNHVVSIIGGGGKTTLLYEMAGFCVKNDQKVLVTTSTHITVRRKNGMTRVWKRSKENFAQAAQRLSGVPAGIRKSFPCRKRNYLKRHAKRPI